MSEVQLTVLVIDDNPDLLKVYTLGLPLVGPFKVVTAADGAAGLEAYYATRPDCVVIDVKMPELDGYQVTRALRGDPETEHTPLIILTAMNQDWDRFQGLASGIDSYLVKPVKPSELAVAVREACALSQAEREHRLQDIAEREQGPHAVAGQPPTGQEEHAP
jgi:CheY-like chemotaxis protein